jgi:hypothetical protein
MVAVAVGGTDSMVAEGREVRLGFPDGVSVEALWAVSDGEACEMGLDVVILPQATSTTAARRSAARRVSKMGRRVTGYPF